MMGQVNEAQAKEPSRARGWLPYVVYALLSLAVLGPLLLPSYILTLDTVFPPHLDFTDSLYGLDESLWSLTAAPYMLVMQLLNGIIPAWLLQKLFILLTLFLAGLGAHRLFQSKGVGAYFAGVLYMINPFTYVRFLAGHSGAILAYALIPFAIKAFIDLLEQANRRNAIKVAVLSTLVGLLQIHGFVLLFLAFLILFLAKVIAERRDLAKLKRAGRYVGISAGLFFALNLYWLIPALTATGTVMSQLGQTDLLFFAPKPSSIFGVSFDIASMHGFWRGGYVYAKDILPFWWVLFAFILFLAIYGFINNYRGAASQRGSARGWVVVSFGIIWVVALLFAVGAASEVTRPAFQWLWEHLFFLQGFRDSQKFVALLCLPYAYLGGLAVNGFAKGLEGQKGKLARIGVMALITVALATPLTYSFTMFGFHGYLGVTDYPQEWYEVNDYLNQDEDDFNVLFLPWHQYMDYSWLPNRDKRLASPAPVFFDKPVISGDNIEVPGIYSQSTNPISGYVEFVLRNRNDIDNMGELLAPLNVKYVILVHEADYQFYDSLYQQEDLTVELEKPGITLFRNEHPTARAYGVDSIVYIEDLEEYLELSRTQDVTEHLYILGSGTSDAMGAGTDEIDLVQRSPVRYQIEGSQMRWTVFTVPQLVNNEHWQYNGRQPIENLGFMPAFESAEDGGEVIYTRFYYVYLPSYIISLAAVVFIVWYYFSRTSKGEQQRSIPKRRAS